MLKALMSRKLLLAAGGAVLAAVLTLALTAALRGSATDATQDARAARGYTDEITVPVYAPNQQRPSMPRPSVLPAMIKSEGECKVAMDAMRDFQDRNPSGLVMSEAASKELTGLLAAVGPGPGAKCTDALSQKFRLQELDPWLSWQPPATPLPAEPTAGQTGP